MILPSFSGACCSVSFIRLSSVNAHIARLQPLTLFVLPVCIGPCKLHSHAFSFSYFLTFVAPVVSSLNYSSLLLQARDFRSLLLEPTLFVSILAIPAAIFELFSYLFDWSVLLFLLFCFLTYNVM